MTAIARLFGEGFRAFFLAAGLYAVAAVAVWLVWFAASGSVDLPIAMAPQHWHAHEMIFGYASAALGGFFLTAVPNWTGAKAARHVFIALAVGAWIAGRAAMWMSGALPPALVALLDLCFLPILAAKIASQLMKRPKPQNVMFLGVIALIWAANLLVHLEWAGVTGDTAIAGLQGGLLATCGLIAVLGGRVTPAFTRNAMTRAGRETGLPGAPGWIDRGTIVSSLALPVAVLLSLPDLATGIIALAAGGFALMRLAFWRGCWTLGQPILWSLHLGYLWLGVGYLLFGLAAFGLDTQIAALHVLGIGTVGGMTLAVMSRATLGHTGRALKAPRPVALAYTLVAAAALLRWAAAAFPALYTQAVLAAGLLWVAAFALFTVALWPAFWGPRHDGRGEA